MKESDSYLFMAGFYFDSSDPTLKLRGFIDYAPYSANPLVTVDGTDTMINMMNVCFDTLWDITINDAADEVSLEAHTLTLRDSLLSNWMSFPGIPTSNYYGEL